MKKAIKPKKTKKIKKRKSSVTTNGSMTSATSNDSFILSEESSQKFKNLFQAHESLQEQEKTLAE